MHRVLVRVAEAFIMRPFTLTSFLRASIVPAVMAACAGGCQCAPEYRTEIDSPSSSALVMPSFEMTAMSDDREDEWRGGFDQWFAMRNDDALGSPPVQNAAEVQWLEIRQRDFLRTINGRPREFSTTYTTTIRRGFSN